MQQDLSSELLRQIHTANLTPFLITGAQPLHKPPGSLLSWITTTMPSPQCRSVPGREGQGTDRKGDMLHVHLGE